MGRVFFPTYRANVIGVRDVGPQTVLRGVDGVDGVIPVPRAPAEPYPRASNNPTGPMLGAAMILANGGGPTSMMVRAPGFFVDGPILPGPMPVAPVDVYQPPTLVKSAPDLPVGLPGSPPSQTPPAPPVSVQTSPTPVVTLPPQAPAGAPIYVSSGGGSPVPATAPITIQTGGDVTSGVAAWLKGSTVIFSYSVPNALLAFAAVLGFAYLSSGTGKRR